MSHSPAPLFTPFKLKHIALPNRIVMAPMTRSKSPNQIPGDDVVAYYKQEYKLRELVEDLRSDKYERLAQARKARVYADYVWQIKTVLLAGERAKAALGASLGSGNLPTALSNPAGAPSPASENR